MTIAAGVLLKRGGCFLISDGRLIDSDTIRTLPEGKFLTLAPGVVAVWAGIMLVRNVATEAAQRVVRGNKLPIRAFVNALRDRLDEARWGAVPQDDVEDGSPSWSLDLLITDGHRLIEIDGSLCVEEWPVLSEAIIGNGRECAVGAFAVAKRYVSPVTAALRVAVTDVCYLHLDCGPPIVERLVRPSKKVRLR